MHINIGILIIIRLYNSSILITTILQYKKLRFQKYKFMQWLVKVVETFSERAIYASCKDFI